MPNNLSLFSRHYRHLRLIGGPLYGRNWPSECQKGKKNNQKWRMNAQNMPSIPFATIRIIFGKQ
jgi:hypothetical protein